MIAVFLSKCWPLSVSHANNITAALLVYLSPAEWTSHNSAVHVRDPFNIHRCQWSVRTCGEGRAWSEPVCNWYIWWNQSRDPDRVGRDGEGGKGAK